MVPVALTAAVSEVIRTPTADTVAVPSMLAERRATKVPLAAIVPAPSTEAVPTPALTPVAVSVLVPSTLAERRATNVGSAAIVAVLDRDADLCLTPVLSP